jgi:oxygen-independent coproporphyrinogen-3 oxidase
MVLAGKLPIVRGLVMNNDDLLRKQVINQLICHFDLEITKFEEQWNIDFKEYFKSEMKQLDLMVEDGLVKVDEKSIKVETRGRLLIRNICMVFDNYLKDNVVKFSKVI